MDIDLDKLHKFSWFMVIVGLLCMVVGAPVFRTMVTSMSQLSQPGVEIDENSTNAIRDAFNYNFTIGSGETVSIEFTGDYVNNTSTLKIVTRAVFDARYLTNSSSSGLTGINFVYSQAVYGGTVSGTAATSATIDTSSGLFLIEFGGATVGTAVKSVPGQYTLVVYGSSITTAGITNDTVKFNIEIAKSIPGRQIATIVNYIGFCLIVGFVAFAIAILTKKTVEGRV
jgi:hypothetical protein